ncbi:MAG: hypothetical protein JF616_19325 [Fibrobacteres bacterium]|nr:hypothetical protein [Fibrobacterota bacterium]
MRFRKNTIWAGMALAAAAAVLAGCSAAPVKMECQELQTRLKYGDLSDDQKRFAEDELAECEGRAKAAESKDSAAVEGLNDRFTPKDSLTPQDPK